MMRALAKGAVQLAFGRVPGGPAAYRALTRGQLGTAASHVDKLARVWPGYVAVWRAHGVTLDGAALWAHDAGATPFMAFAAYALTGTAPTTTNAHDTFRDRYLAHARAGVLAAAWPADAIPPARAARIEGLRWAPTAAAALAELGTHVHRASAELADASIDLCHSGGALEHESPAALRALLAEQVRVLKPGGVASHVVDHRDHLHHTDRARPFLAHLAWPGAAYRAVFGHPLGYHSRLAPTEIAALFADVGFEPLALRRLIYDAATGERRWVEDEAATVAGAPGIARCHLADAFRAISEPDLRTAAAHYVFRRRTL